MAARRSGNVQTQRKGGQALCCECGNLKALPRPARASGAERNLPCEVCGQETKHATVVDASVADYREQMNQRRTRLSVPDQIALLRSWGVDVEERGAENDSRGQARIADVRWFSDPDRFEVTTYSGAEGLAETLEKIATMVTDPRGSRWFIERDEGGETCGGCSWVR